MGSYSAAQVLHLTAMHRAVFLWAKLASEKGPSENASGGNFYALVWAGAAPPKPVASSPWSLRSRWASDDATVSGRALSSTVFLVVTETGNHGGFAFGAFQQP